MSAPPTPSPVDQVFTPGLRVWGGEGIRVVRDSGSLPTPSGALLLGDPLELATAPRLPSGAGPIAVHLATVRMSGEHELAAVRVVLGPGEVRRWKKTRKVCATDSATACLCDAGLVEALRDEAVRRRFTKRWERFAALSLSAQRASFGRGARHAARMPRRHATSLSESRTSAKSSTTTALSASPGSTDSSATMAWRLCKGQHMR